MCFAFAKRDTVFCLENVFLRQMQYLDFLLNWSEAIVKVEYF